MSAPGATAGERSSWALVHRLVAGYLRPHLSAILIGVIAMGIAAAATAVNAWLMQPVLDDVFMQRNPTMLYLVPIAVILSAFVKGIGTYGQSMLMTKVGQRILSTLQTELFAHLMRADLAFFHDTPTGGLMSRFTSDVWLMRNAVTQSLTGMVKDSLTVVFLVALMFYQDWEMALIAFVAFPLAIFPIVRIGRRLRKVSTTTQSEIGTLSSLLEETFQGARHVKAYGMEEYETRRASAVIENLYRLIMKATRARSATHPIMETLGSVAVALVIFYGGSRVITGATTPGVFFSFVTALLLAYQPVKNLANLNANLQEGLAAAARVFALLDMEPTIRDRAAAKPLPAGPGELRFDDVHFSYNPAKPALHGVSLVVPAGRTVALVGPSGGGKTTLLNLIPRFYDVDRGRVLVDGHDVREVTLASLRERIAIVSQEVSLFHDSVRANIAYGRPEASDAEIRRAAQLAGAAEFIDGLPQGYDTLVGERGTKLSGGQRQRIAIARALIKNAPILLLDEATSSLDNESERVVQAALTTLMEGRTTLVVAHRLSTIADADLIYVIEDGRVIEQGRHAELIARGRTYARLYTLQAGDSSIEGARARA